MSGAPFSYVSEHGGEGTEDGGAVIGVRTEVSEGHAFRMELHADDSAVFVDKSFHNAITYHNYNIHILYHSNFHKDIQDIHLEHP